MADEPEAPNPDRLDGWKRIAAYLDLSQRSAQRYAKEHGLPVHFRTLHRGQRVFAYSHELAQWLDENHSSQKDHGTAVSEDTKEVGGENHNPAAVEASARPWFNRGTIVAICAALLVGAFTGTAFVQPPFRLEGPPASFILVGRSLEASDSKGRFLWSHDFGRDVSEAATLDGGIGPYANVALALTDLDGDGSLEVVVPVRFAIRGQKPATSDELYVFSIDGEVLWTVEAPESVTCGSTSFGGPWGIYAAVISPEPGPKKIWVAFNHHTWWPGLVVEADGKGRQLLRYAQTGWVFSLAPWTTASGSFLVAGGVTNEQERPILSIIDTAGPPAINPTADPRFACLGLPSANPRAVHLLANDELGTAETVPYSIVAQVRALGDSLKATIVATRAGQIVELSPDLRVASYSFTDSHWLLHRKFELEGKIDHAVEDCPERLSRPIRSWTSLTGWQDYVIAPTVRTISTTAASPLGRSSHPGR